MHPSAPFPIERCSARLKIAILAEFDGRSPTFQDILSISPKRWLTVPGMGTTLLKELHDIAQNPSVVAQGDSCANPDDADLLARIHRFQRDLNRLRHDIQGLMREEKFY